MVHIRLTQHAMQRMRERGITREQIGECLEKFTVSRPGDGDNRVYDFIDQRGYKISVSATKENEEWVVV